MDLLIELSAPYYNTIQPLQKNITILLKGFRICLSASPAEE